MHRVPGGHPASVPTSWGSLSKTSRPRAICSYSLSLPESSEYSTTRKAFSVREACPRCGERVHDCITPSVFRLSLVTILPHCQISVITWGILFVSVSHACQGSRSAVLLHCLMSISFLLWDLESVSSEDTPYPELGTQALHFSLETWIYRPQESITIQAVSSSARIETARKCSV